MKCQEINYCYFFSLTFFFIILLILEDLEGQLDAFGQFIYFDYFFLYLRVFNLLRVFEVYLHITIGLSYNDVECEG